jgi:hypothetical protein
MLQGRMGRRVEGRAAKQCRIKALVRAGRPRVLPTGVLAWRGELASHASLWGSLCVEVAPRSHRMVLVGGGDCSRERAGCRRRGRDSSCETENPHATQRLVVRGGDLSGKPSLSRSLSRKLPTGRKQDVLRRS